MMADRKIVIVEDDKGVRETLEDLFKKEGYEVSSARDGEEGLNQIMQRHPDVVILDVMMPKMDGYEVLTSLQQNESVRDTPVIMLTSLGLEEDIKKGIALGATQYLTKPVRNSTVIKCVKTVLNSD